MAHAQRIRGQRIAVAAMLAFLVGYFAIVIGVQFAQSVRYGYGSGFSNRGHVPAQVLKGAHLPAGTPERVVAQRTDRVGGGGVWHDGWRLVTWAIVVVAITGFWMLVVKGVGTI